MYIFGEVKATFSPRLHKFTSVLVTKKTSSQQRNQHEEKIRPYGPRLQRNLQHLSIPT